VARTCKINGVKYTITVVDGVEVWDPPRPEGDEEKCKKRFKEMIRSRSAPRANDDTVFLSDRPRFRDCFASETDMNLCIKELRKQGVEPKSTDLYLHGVARRRGDASALFSAGDGMGKIKKICEKRGVGCEGAVTVNAPEAKLDPAEKPKTPRKAKFDPEF